MKFRRLSVNQAFSSETYPDAVFIKTRESKGTCCTAPQNAKMIILNGEVPIEKPIMFDKEAEVTVLDSAITLESLQHKDSFTSVTEMIKTIQPEIVVEQQEIPQYSHNVELTIAKDGGLQDANGNLVNVEQKTIVPRDPIVKRPLRGGGTF
jgi:hypothetical protein